MRGRRRRASGRSLRLDGRGQVPAPGPGSRPTESGGRRLIVPVAAVAVAVVVVGVFGIFAALSRSGSAKPSWRANAVSSSATGPSGSAAVSPSASTPPAASPTPSATAGTPATCAPWDCQQTQRFKIAEDLIRSKSGQLGIVVRDRVTGAVWRAGTPSHPTWTSSTIKLAIATSVLERGRAGEVTVDATARSQIAAMFSTSDNDAADALWNRYGKDGMVGRFQQVYGMSGLTFVSGSQRYWGFMKCTAEDLQRLVTYVLERLNATDRATIMGGMRTVAPIQQWGVWAAGSAMQPGTKDGWSIESDGGTKHWCTSTVGFAGPDARYAVAVMYDLPAGSVIDTGVHAVSDLVATVFGASVPAPVTVPDPSTGL